MGATANLAEQQTLGYASIKAGVAAREVVALIEAGRLTRADVQMVIPRRTFERRVAESQVLKIDEADAIARLVRVRDHALRVFEDEELAQQWLSLPNPALGEAIPLEMARTDVGAREAEAVLGRIEHGIFS